MVVRVSLATVALRARYSLRNDGPRLKSRRPLATSLSAT